MYEEGVKEERIEKSYYGLEWHRGQKCFDGTSKKFFTMYLYDYGVNPKFWLKKKRDSEKKELWSKK